MQIQSIQNQQSFKGKVFVNGLSKKQQKVYDKIESVVTEMLKDKNYNLFIDGNAKPDLNCIHRDHRVIPRFVNFLTRPDNSKLEPSASSFSGSFEPDMWLMHVNNLIERHEKSPLYKPKTKDFDLITIATSSTKKEKSFSKKLKTFINKIFSPNRNPESISRPTPENHAEMEKQAFAEIIQRMQAGEKGPFKIDYYHDQKPKIHNLSDKK